MDKYFSLNVDDLRDKYKNRCNNRTKIYNKLLEKCYYRIKGAANNDETYCMYVIPDFVLGMPTYNMVYCAAFIIYNLKKNGFNSKFFNPNVIFVKWDYQEPYYIQNNKKTITYNDTTPLLMPPTSNTSKYDTSKIIEIPKVNQSYRSVNDYKPTGNFIMD